MTTTAATGITVDLRNAGASAANVVKWGTKGAALAALAGLRENGLNRDRDIEVHRAETYLFWVWVIGRPDHYNGVTYLMTRTGEWVPGRLHDATPCWCESLCRNGHSAPWMPLAGEPLPATVTHDYQFSAGQVGVVGHDGKPLMSTGLVGMRPVEVTSYSAFAWCVACSWSTNDSHDDTVRARARYHRTHPDEYPHHAVPRRTSALGVAALSRTARS